MAPIAGRRILPLTGGMWLQGLEYDGMDGADRMDFGFTGKTVLVLGGGVGLGCAISMAPAREGANIAFADIESAAIAAEETAVTGAMANRKNIPM